MLSPIQLFEKFRCIAFKGYSIIKGGLKQTNFKRFCPYIAIHISLIFRININSCPKKTNQFWLIFLLRPTF